jgi:hypothetical protein
VLLRGLSVFVGGFALDAAEAVCGGETVLDELTGLVDKSLVVAERRYRLLEPIRQYAASKLVAAGEATALRARHRDWYLGFAERAVDGMIAPDQVAWYARLSAEHDNLRAALQFSRVEPDPEAELRLVGALAAFWARRAEHQAEGRARIDDVLPRTEHVSSLAARRARVLALDWRGYLDDDDDTAHAQRAVALARELGDGALLATALRHLAGHGFSAYGLASSPAAQARGDLAEAERLSTEALVVLRQAGDRDALRFGLGVSAWLALARGDRERARAELEEGAACQRELF